jgi:plastocyanin
MVTGVEYRFDGVPATATAGTVLGFTNAGQEAHELVAVRRNDDVTMSFQELLALPQEEALSMVSIAGGVTANPGETADATVTLAEPGTYALLCFVPVGMTEIPESLDPNASLPTGAPHFTQGMIAEVTVAG